MKKNHLPVLMITTTKTKMDMKGGQIAIKKTPFGDCLTIFEKAQAEESGQLKYFEELGLREGDSPAYFNTNVALINTEALRGVFENLGMEAKEFMRHIHPEVIRNVKEQDGKKFTQLESAMGSILLNMNAFFVEATGKSILTIINIPEKDRHSVFLPIKTRSDYDEYLENYEVSTETCRLVPKK